VIIVLSALYYYRQVTLHQNIGYFIALILACAWIWLGPILIWYYERYTLPRFSQQCKDLIADPGQRREINQIVYSNVHADTIGQAITVVWMSAALSIFLASLQILARLGVRGEQDPFFWIIGVGAVLVSFYTSIGFCLAYKGIRLVYKLSKATYQDTLYRDDGMFGLSFVG